jgi:hypothetical protein
MAGKSITAAASPMRSIELRAASRGVTDHPAVAALRRDGRRAGRIGIAELTPQLLHPAFQRRHRCEEFWMGRVNALVSVHPANASHADDFARDDREYRHALREMKSLLQKKRAELGDSDPPGPAPVAPKCS